MILFNKDDINYRVRIKKWRWLAYFNSLTKYDILVEISFLYSFSSKIGRFGDKISQMHTVIVEGKVLLWNIHTLHQNIIHINIVVFCLFGFDSTILEIRNVKGMSVRNTFILIVKRKVWANLLWRKWTICDICYLQGSCNLFH